MSNRQNGGRQVPHNHFTLSTMLSSRLLWSFINTYYSDICVTLSGQFKMTRHPRANGLQIILMTWPTPSGTKGHRPSSWCGVNHQDYKITWKRKSNGEILPAPVIMRRRNLMKLFQVRLAILTLLKKANTIQFPRRFNTWPVSEYI